MGAPTVILATLQIRCACQRGHVFHCSLAAHGWCSGTMSTSGMISRSEFKTATASLHYSLEERMRGFTYFVYCHKNCRRAFALTKTSPSPMRTRGGHVAIHGQTGGAKCLAAFCMACAGFLLVYVGQTS